MILDTNAISAWAEGDAALLDVLRSDRLWRLPSIALGEFRYAVLGSKKREELEAWLDSVEAACEILAPDAVTARYYGELRRAVEASGQPVPYHDVWIGALAKQHDLDVVSRDTHFDRIAGIRRISW